MLILVTAPACNAFLWLICDPTGSAVSRKRACDGSCVHDGINLLGDHAHVDMLSCLKHPQSAGPE